MQLTRPTMQVNGVRAPPARSMAKTGSEKAVSFKEWARPCELAPTLLQQQIMEYDVSEYDFVGAAEAIFGHSLAELQNTPLTPVSETAPALRRAQIQARVGPRVTKEERKLARSRAWCFERSAEWREFMDVYERFVAQWVVPQLGDTSLLYQRKPILRVVLPGSVAPTQLHCDADYYHDSNELNFWVPLTHCWGANSLWSESVSGLGDYAAFDAGPGQAVRFYGNRCRHYTVPNDSNRVRVSFDFRVIQKRLFVPPTPLASTLSQHALDPGASKKGCAPADTLKPPWPTCTAAAEPLTRFVLRPSVQTTPSYTVQRSQRSRLASCGVVGSRRRQAARRPRRHLPRRDARVKPDF
eukprot:7286821-Prymnesium_polylepis.1